MTRPDDRVPGPDDGLLRGVAYAIGPCLVVWALIFAAIHYGWNV